LSTQAPGLLPILPLLPLLLLFLLFLLLLFLLVLFLLLLRFGRQATPHEDLEMEPVAARFLQTPPRLHLKVRLASDQGAPLEGVLVSPRGGETNYWTNEQTRTDL